MSNTAIKFWGLSTCIHCKKAKQYLDDCGVSYDLTYVDKLEGDARRQAVDEIRKHNAALSFPTILIGDTVVVGYNEEDLKKALGR